MISKKYIKLLFATESFAIGLDCPIKTAMFASLTKYDGHYDRFLMGHEYTQMAGRAGRRGIDTIGHVVHLNNLFAVPMQPDYMSILKGRPQALVSKFRISYSLLLSLLKNGKNTFDDFRKFVSNSMAQNETASAIENQRTTIIEGKAQIDHLEEKMRTFPKDVTERYVTIQTDLLDPSLSKKKRRKYEDELDRFGKEHREFASALSNIETQKTQIQKDEDVLFNLEQYIDESIRRVCNVLIDNGFVEMDDEEYRLTKSGTIASSIAEVHPLIMTTLMKQNNMFEEFDRHQLIGLLACFTNVNVNKECKRLFPHSDDEFLKQIICNTSEWMTDYEDLENMEGIQSGIDYQDALNFDMPDLSIMWAKCDNEMECKSFVQQIGYEKGISIGDFTKAMMKISTISRELCVIAEMEGHVSLLHTLKEMDGVLLKYITTSQSLYV
jgi:superfamily II RNA helicase